MYRPSCTRAHPCPLQLTRLLTTTPTLLLLLLPMLTLTHALAAPLLAPLPPKSNLTPRALQPQLGVQMVAPTA